MALVCRIRTGASGEAAQVEKYVRGVDEFRINLDIWNVLKINSINFTRIYGGEIINIVDLLLSVSVYIFIKTNLPLIQTVFIIFHVIQNLFDK